MPILFAGKTKQVTYDGGKFWIHTKLESEPAFNPIRHEINLDPADTNNLAVRENLEGVDGKKYSLALVEALGNKSVYRRSFDSTRSLYIYEQCDDLAGSPPRWVNIDPRILAPVTHYFLSVIDKTTPIPTQSPVSEGQKSQIAEQLLTGAGLLGVSLETIKSKYPSREEYDACLKHLIEGAPAPTGTAELIQDLTDFKALLIPATLQKLALNNSSYYGGHIATAGEVYTYARDFFIAELKKGQPDYVAPALNLAADPNWNLLCSPGSDLPAEIDLATQTTAKKMLDSIMAVYKPNGTVRFGVQPDVTRAQLTKAIETIEQINRIEHRTPLGQCLTPFVIQICKHAKIGGLFPAGGPEGLGSFRDPFLTTLRTAIEAKLPTLFVDAPLRNQFIPLRVDQRAGGPGGATHADFVEFQKQHPNAILLIPDNFAEAALPDNRRHQRDPGNRGLAIPMKPHIVDNTDRANPVYDLCTLGIPTAHPSPGMGLEAQKAEVRKYFARLYGELRRGREIAVPQLDDSGNVRWAFGGGVVDVSTPLSQFVRDELTKLKNFCEGAEIDEAVDAAYKAAWDHALIAPLPLPKPELAPPPPAPESQVPGMQADKSLTSAGFRHKFRKWLESKNCQLIEDEDEKDKTRLLLRGTLPSGVGVIIRKDQMRLDTKGGKPLTDDEFRQSMSELIDMYKSAYHPGQIPPARPLGNDRQKAIIEELLVAKGVPMVAKPAETPAADSSAEEAAAPRRTL